MAEDSYVALNVVARDKEVLDVGMSALYYRVVKLLLVQTKTTPKLHQNYTAEAFNKFIKLFLF